MKIYDDLQDYEKEQIDLAVADYFEANNYTNFLAASETLNLSVPAVWNKILREAGVARMRNAHTDGNQVNVYS